MAIVKFTAELVVSNGQLDSFKRIAQKMNAIVRNDEPATLSCQWFFHEGGNKWYLTETFTDAQALLKHLGDVGPQLDQLLEISEVTRFEVFGDMLLEAKAAMAPFGVKYFTYWDGIARDQGGMGAVSKPDR